MKYDVIDKMAVIEMEDTLGLKEIINRNEIKTIAETITIKDNTITIKVYAKILPLFIKSIKDKLKEYQ